MMDKAYGGLAEPGIRPFRQRRHQGILSQDWACDMVVALVAKQKGVPVRLLTHQSRCRAKTARARQLAMYLSHVVLGRSLAEVGEAFGRDRTTVSHACATIEDLRDDPAMEAEIIALERSIAAELAAREAMR